jgi:carbon monoxide dehydrogenase subunit G
MFSILRTMTSGGRSLLTAALVMLIVVPAAPASAQKPAPDVVVREDHGVYTVVAQFVVEQPPAAVMAVLTNYERIPRFMPGVRTSVVRERGAGWAVLEQEAQSSVMLFSKRVHLVLEIEERADALFFKDRCHQSFARYAGAWRLVAQQGHTAVTYELTAIPSFKVPGFLLSRLLRRDSGQMIAALQKEIAASLR